MRLQYMKTFILITMVTSIFCSSCASEGNVYEKAIEAYIDDIYYREIPTYRIVFEHIKPIDSLKQVDSEYILEYNRNLHQIRNDAISHIKQLFDSLGIKMPEYNRYSPPDGATGSYPISGRESDIIMYARSDSLFNVQRVECRLYLEGDSADWRYQINDIYELSEDGKICLGVYEIRQSLNVTELSMK